MLFLSFKINIIDKIMTARTNSSLHNGFKKHLSFFSVRIFPLKMKFFQSFDTSVPCNHAKQ